MDKPSDDWSNDMLPAAPLPDDANSGPQLALWPFPLTLLGHPREAIPTFEDMTTDD